MKISRIIYKIDKHSKVPLYHQLNINILESIKAGILKPGDFLPSEEEICQMTGLSRGTVRQAINNLVEKGRVIRERGKGTQIKPPTLNHDLIGDFSFAKGIKKIGINPITKVLDKKIVVGKKGVTDRLNVKKKSKVLKLSRLRYADKEPWIYEVTYLAVEKYPGIEEHNFEEQSLVDILAKKYNTVLSQINAFVEPTIIDEKFANLLEVGKGIPALVIDRVLFNEEGKPAVYSHAYIRGDRCRYYFNVSR